MPEVEAAVTRLLTNLQATPPPLSLLSQFLPRQYAAVRAGTLRLDARELVLHHVDGVLEQYASACAGSAP